MFKGHVNVDPSKDPGKKERCHSLTEPGDVYKRQGVARDTTMENRRALDGVRSVSYTHLDVYKRQHGSRATFKITHVRIVVGYD